MALLLELLVRDASMSQVFQLINPGLLLEATYTITEGLFLAPENLSRK